MKQLQAEQKAHLSVLQSPGETSSTLESFGVAQTGEPKGDVASAMSRAWGDLDFL